MRVVHSTPSRDDGTVSKRRKRTMKLKYRLLGLLEGDRGWTLQAYAQNFDTPDELDTYLEAQQALDLLEKEAKRLQLPIKYCILPCVNLDYEP